MQVRAAPKCWLRVKIHQKLVKKSQGVMGREVATPPAPSVCPFSCLLSALMENHTQNSEVNFPHLSRLSRYPVLSGPPLQRFSDLFFILHRLATVQAQSRTIPYSWLPTLCSQSKPCLHLYASFQVLQENLCSSTPLPSRNGHLPSVPTATVLFSFRGRHLSFYGSVSHLWTHLSR